MSSVLRLLILSYSLLWFTFAHAETDSVQYIRVHFLYGSKPKKGFDGETKHFGGLHGGHVAIEASGRTIGFNPLFTYHIFPRKKKKQGAFSHDFGNLEKDTVGKKYAVFVVPVSAENEKKIDSLHSAYLKKTPYDYAFFGFRCAAATWDILEEAGVVERKSRLWKVVVIFYPRRIRKRMFRYAEKMDWEIIRNEGSKSRIWEKDL